MLTNNLLVDGFDRVSEVAHDAIVNLSEDQLAFRPAGKGNSIAWLVWHIARVIDGQLAPHWDGPEIWPDWKGKFNFDVGDSTGYGHSSEEVDRVRASAEQLAGYFDAVLAKTASYLQGLSESDYAEIVDSNWNPPVSLEVRLVSILVDVSQHVGQAAYVRGLLPK